MVRSADPVCEKAHQGGCRGALARAAEDLARRRLDVDRKNLAAWDAWAAVRRDALADGCPELPQLGADAEKLVAPELACLGPDALTLDVSADPAAVPLLLGEAPQLALVELDKPGAGPSAARSCAVPEVVGERAGLVKPIAELVPELDLKFVRRAPLGRN